MRFRRRTRNILRQVQYLFMILGILSLGCCAIIYIDTAVYQSYESWSFDRSLKGQSASVGEYLGHWFHDESSIESPEVSPNVTEPEVPRGATARPPVHPHDIGGPLIGRIDIPSIHLSAIVLEGVDSRTLRRAVGHIPGTALPGQPGNFAVAGHRDTFFRGLRKIHKDDAILFTTPERSYHYVVDAIEVVGPNNNQVLKPSGRPTLTLVTCYPFAYIGTAPRRFIVVAREIANPPQLPGS